MLSVAFRDFSCFERYMHIMDKEFVKNYENIDRFKTDEKDL